jgi:hypothetical protein
MISAKKIETISEHLLKTKLPFRLTNIRWVVVILIGLINLGNYYAQDTS